MSEQATVASTRDPAAEPDGIISVERRGHVLLIGLDRPEKYNGMTPKMFRELGEAYTLLDEDADLRVGVLFAHGKHFTAGLELTRFAEGMKKGGDGASGGVTSAPVDPFALKRKCTKPVISAVQGITYTAGLEMMLASDIVIAADDVRFSQLEPKRGVMAAGGGTIRFIERCGWGNGMYHLLLSDEFGAEEGKRIGIVQEIVPAGEHVARALEIAEQIAKLAPLAVQATKASSMQYLVEGEQAAIAALGETQARLANTEDAAEGVRSFVERREAVFTGK